MPIQPGGARAYLSDVEPTGEIIPGLRSTDLRTALKVDSIHILVRLSEVHPIQTLGIVATRMVSAKAAMVSLISAHCEAWMTVSLLTDLRIGPRPVVQGVPTPCIAIRGCGPLVGRIYHANELRSPWSSTTGSMTPGRRGASASVARSGSAPLE